MKFSTSLAACLMALNIQAADKSSLTLVKTIALPGVKGRFDHFAIDAKGTRLFVAALGSRKNHVGGCGFIRVYAGGGRLGLHD